MLLQQQCHLWLETGTKAITALLSQQDCIGLNEKLNDYISPINPENMVKTSPHVFIRSGGPE